MCRLAVCFMASLLPDVSVAGASRLSLSQGLTHFSCVSEILQQKKREEAEAEQMRAAMEEWNRQHRAKSLREMAEAGAGHFVFRFQ